jgi:tetratricopeptide (TPR) repeat protein
MKRAHGHLAFALVASALGVLTAGEALRLQHAQRINSAVAGWVTTASSSDAPAAPANSQAMAGDPHMATANPETPAGKLQTAPGTLHTTAANPQAAAAGTPNANPAAISPKWTAGAADHLPPEARLARAVALSRLDYDGALAAYKSIIQSNREDLHRLALYDLGNLHLRQAVQYGLADEAQSLPLTELAKQSYRDLLRRDPTDWDARYNLERALRLAPEEDADASEDTNPPDPREHQRSTIADPRMDLP